MSTELAVGLATGGALRLGRVGKAALAFDTASNALGVGRGAIDAYNNGLSVSSAVQVVGSGLGLGGNFATGGRALGELASDAGSFRLQFDSATFSSGGLRGARIVRVGQQGEAIASQFTGAAKNTQKFAVNGRNRIPDFVFSSKVATRTPFHIGEVKKVAYQAYTRQLRDQADLVGSRGRVDVFLPANARVSGPLQEAFNRRASPLNRVDLLSP